MQRSEFKYLTLSNEDINWGLYLKVAGIARIPPNTGYPSPKHPSEYYFKWKEGRILDEFQINFISEGAGILENRYGRFPLKRGSIFITFPGEWHRYRPSSKLGWTENYIGFNGTIADHLMKMPAFSATEPVYNFGMKEEFIDTYLKIFDLVDKEKPGYQQIASGMVLKLIGYIVSFGKQKGFTGKPIAATIESIRFEMRQNLMTGIDFLQLAAKYNVSYSYFRKMFRKYTGVSPGQYMQQLKLTRARELLLTTDKNIKEISYELGFKSIFYFSNSFKKREGISPSEFRRKNRIDNS